MDMATILILISIGSAAGILAGFFGIGGGIIIIPSLIYLLDYSQHKATGTSLAVLLPPVGIAAFIEYYRNGNVDLKAAILIAIAAIIGGWFGAVCANRLSAPVLRLSFGVLISGLGLSLIYSSLKKLLFT